MILDENEMIRIAQVGTGQARQIICNRHNLTWVCTRDLEDMCQAATIRLWKANEKIGGEDRPFAFWLIVARRAALRCFEHLFDGNVLQSFDEKSFDTISTYKELRAPLSPELKQQIFDMLLNTRRRHGREGIAHTERDVFILETLRQGRTTREIAQALGEPYKRIHTARSRLFERLKSILEART